MPGAITGLFGNIGKDLFGSKPDVPPVERLTLAEEQQKALDANIAAAPKAAELARLSQEQILSMMNFAIPGFTGLSNLATGNIGAALKGLIPADVSQAVRQSSAATSLSGGYGGTGMARNLVARDLGTTSLAQQRWGQSALQGWLTTMEQLFAPSQALYSSSFVTPMQQYETERSEANLQFGRSWLVNQISAMPDPVARGIYDTVLELVNSYLGGSHQSFNPQASTTGAASTSLGGGGTPGVGPAYGGWGANTNSGPGASGGGLGNLGGAPSIPFM